MHDRLVPARPLPESPFVPGVEGTRPVEPKVDGERFILELGENEDFRYAVDLYHHGFAWEAHAYWEAMWHAAGREGELADLLRALVKLAAARVKLRQGSARGVRSHLEGAVAIFSTLASDQRTDATGLGVDVKALASRLAGMLAEADAADSPSDHLMVVFSKVNQGAPLIDLSS